MANDQPELPLLQPQAHHPRSNPLNQRRVLSSDNYGSSASMTSSGGAANNGSGGGGRSLAQRVAPALVWIAIGCSASMLVQQQSNAPASSVVDFTHGDNVRHALQLDTDVLAVCPNKTAVEEKAQEPEFKDTNWFLGGRDPELVLTSLPPVKSLADLPAHWDWRDYNGSGLSLVTSIQNQMVPKPCGSCWAFATASALSDRIRIAKYKKTGKLGPEIQITPQALLDCGMRSFGSCSGGDPRHAHKWIHENGIVDTTCNPYIAAHPSWMDASTSCGNHQCRHCTLDGTCKTFTNPKKYFVSEYGTLNATTSPEFELEAMNEIYHRGPIVVSMYSHSTEYVDYTGGFVLRNPTKFPGTTHVVNLIGWGTDDNGVKYWIVRNSYGTNWGDEGFFLAERGVNAYNLENHGAWAVPIV